MPFRLFTLLALPRALSAQPDWGLSGSWQLLTPRTPGPPLAYRGPTHTAGCVIVMGNSTDETGVMTGYEYDFAANEWRTWPDLYPLYFVDPFLIALGGQVMVIDETSPTTIAFIDAAAARSRIGYEWTIPTVTGGPDIPRYGQRYVVWGPTILSFGGVEIATGILHNDMWAISGGAIVTREDNPPPSWSQVADDGVVGFPPARVGYSFTAFGTVIILFGGVSLHPSAPQGTDPSVCFLPDTAGVCEFHNHVWMLEPGNPGPASEITISAAQWTRLEASAMTAAPLGRFDHTAGAIGDQLFIFGGTTAAGGGNAGELWAFNILTQTWGAILPSAPAPSTLTTDAAYGVNVWMGRHLYRYAQSISAASQGEPIPGTGQLWRWAPGVSSGAPSSCGSAPPAALSSGATAAVVISLLIGAANLALLIVIVRSNDALPALDTVFSACTRGCGGVKGPAGFYSSSTSSSAGADGYAAPPL